MAVFVISKYYYSTNKRHCCKCQCIQSEGIHWFFFFSAAMNSIAVNINVYRLVIQWLFFFFEILDITCDIKSYFANTCNIMI